MAGTITGLKAQERSKDRVNVFLDGEYAFGLTLFHALWLRIGQTLTDEEIAELKDADTLEKAKQRALGLISYRPRSVQEVRQRLQRVGVDAETVGEVIESLQNSGLLDDASFSKAWVESRTEASPRSKRMIEWELRQKGVGQPAIERSLAEVNDEESAHRLVLKRWPRVSRLQPAGERRRKLTEYLARHGFGYDTIQEAIARVEAEQAAALSGDENTDLDSDGHVMDSDD